MSDGALLPSLAACKLMLRDCYWWRRLMDSDNPWSESEAASRIHFDGLPPPDPGPDHSIDELEALRPFALLWHDVSGGFRMRSDTAGNCCAIVSGVTIIQIEIPVPEELADSPSALAIDTNRKYGRLLRTGNPDQPGLWELSGIPGYLSLRDIMVRGYIRTDSKAATEIGDAIVAEFELHWGQE